MRRGGIRGNNMSHPQNNPNQPPFGGPRMTGHLQGLQDIDMELELLKRKREIIEQQQNMMSNTYRGRNDFEQPQFNQSSNNNYKDYSRLYDNPRDSQGYGGGPSNRKRPHIPVWENESPPKRFSAPSRGVRKPFGSRLGPPSNNRPYKPRPNLPPPPSQKKKEFTPTKVTKNSGGPPPSKLASCQPAERKKLVAETLASSGAKVCAPPGGLDAWILRADREPNRQVAGRLELALGEIMKDLKLAHPDSIELFKHTPATRVMKQVVRDRIRTAMIGKVVTTADAIKAIYYEMFPCEGDDHVVMKALEAYKNLPPKSPTVKADNAETYFKKNIYKILAMKLDEMTTKLEQHYSGKSGIINYKRHRSYYSDLSKTKVFPGMARSNAEEAQLETKTNTPQTNPNEETVQSIMKEEPEPVITQAQPGETEIKTASPTEPVGAAQITEKISFNDIDPPPELINTAQYMAFDKLITTKVLHLLKKFSPNILKIMDVDQMFIKAKEDILNETRQMLVGNVKDEQQPPQNEDQKGADVTPKKEYHVKILGKPSLPKRAAMDDFFSEFKPVYIKRHRTAHNLLFAGFTEKESFDKILAANGKVLGAYTLDIRVSERNSELGKKKQSNADVDSKTTAANIDDQPIIIGSDLDEQITDLLSSIRKAEQDSSSDDVILFEPPANVDQNNVQKENGDQPGKTDHQINKESDAAFEIAEPKKEVKEEPNENTPEVQDYDEDAMYIEDDPAFMAQPDSEEVKGAENDDVVTSLKTEVKDDKETTAVASGGEVSAENDNAEKKEVVTSLKTEVKDVNGTPTQASGGEVKGAENDNGEKKDAVTDLNTGVKDVKGTPTQASGGEVKGAENDAAQKKDVVTDLNTGEKNVKGSPTQASDAENDVAEKKDVVTDLKTETKDVKGTPTRASARLATPSGIRTRRMSKLE